MPTEVEEDMRAVIERIDAALDRIDRAIAQKEQPEKEILTRLEQLETDEG